MSYLNSFDGELTCQLQRETNSGVSLSLLWTRPSVLREYVYVTGDIFLSSDSGNHVNKQLLCYNFINDSTVIRKERDKWRTSRFLVNLISIQVFPSVVGEVSMQRKLNSLSMNNNQFYKLLLTFCNLLTTVLRYAFSFVLRK